MVTKNLLFNIKNCHVDMTLFLIHITFCLFDMNLSEQRLSNLQWNLSCLHVYWNKLLLTYWIHLLTIENHLLPRIYLPSILGFSGGVETNSPLVHTFFAPAFPAILCLVSCVLMSCVMCLVCCVLCVVCCVLCLVCILLSYVRPCL